MVGVGAGFAEKEFSFLPPRQDTFKVIYSGINADMLVA